MACLARNVDKAAETAAECARLVGSDDAALAVACDITDGDQVIQAVAEVTEKLGAIQIVVNNAGVTADNLLARMKQDEWDIVVNTNLGGCYRVTKAALRSLLKARSAGRVINVSSVVGTVGNAGQVNYAASKAGIVGFTKSLAKELSPRGVTVNAIAPGFIETDMTAALDEQARLKVVEHIGLARLGTGDDIASAAVFLASESASYITGTVIPVDGGLVI